MKNTKIRGTQSLARGLAILRTLSGHHLEGLRLTDIAERLSLEPSTVHRLLACLDSEQFVEKNPDTRKYHLGLASMQVGFDASERLPLVEKYRPVIHKLARISGDNVFLVARQGDYAVCLYKTHGDFPISINTTVVGGKRLLGMGAGGNALMAGLKNSEVEAIYKRHEQDYSNASISLDFLISRLDDTRQRGYSKTTDAISAGISAVGALVPLSGRPFAAISIGSITARMSDNRCEELGRLIRDNIANSQPERTN